MQAITTLHAQLCLATEKLETAQKSLIAQKNEMVIIEEEGRIKRNEMKELSELMVSSREEEKMGLDKLGELKLRTLPLELEYQKASGAMEVLPQAFQKLSDDFVLKSRRTMSQIECLLSQAIQESFWRNKIMMNLHHLNASRLRLREQTTVLNQSLVAEEEALNQQLAEEESSLAMVQACIETLEMKNGQLLSEKGGRDKPQSFASPYLSGHSMSPTNQVETSDEHPISSLKISNDCTTSDTTMDLNESVCHGCHKAGHFIGSCPECYKCQHCYKHHVRGKSCSSKYYSGVGSSIDARMAPIASVAPVPARIPATSSENLKPRELHLSYETPLTKSGAKHDSNNSSSCMSRSSPLQTDRSAYAKISDPPLGNRFHRSLAPQYQQSQPQPPGQQQQKQWEQHTLQVEGHVTHTLTHTVTEVQPYILYFVLHKYTCTKLCNRSPDLASSLSKNLLFINFFGVFRSLWSHIMILIGTEIDLEMAKITGGILMSALGFNL